MKTEIIVVEDNPYIQEIIEIILGDTKKNITICSTISECKKYIAQNPPNLLILDVMLPDGNGIDFCTELKSGNQFSEIPVIIMSATAKRAEALRAGAEIFIHKPFNIKEFRDAALHCLGHLGVIVTGLAYCYV